MSNTPITPKALEKAGFQIQYATEGFFSYILRLPLSSGIDVIVNIGGDYADGGRDCRVWIRGETTALPTQHVESMEDLSSLCRVLGGAELADFSPAPPTPHMSPEQKYIWGAITSIIEQYLDESAVLATNMFEEKYNVGAGIGFLASVLRLEAKAVFLQRVKQEDITIKKITGHMADVTQLLRTEARVGEVGPLETLVAAERAYGFATLLNDMEFWISILTTGLGMPAQSSAKSK